MLHVMNADQKIKKYIRVAIILTVITFTELTVVTLHFMPPGLVTLLVVGLSLTKAYMVAWHFMHLNHERSWTRIVAMLPLGMLIYAGVLIADQKFRPMSEYIGDKARTVDPAFLAHEAEEKAAETQNETHAEAVPMQTEESPAPTPTTSPTPTTTTPSEAPAAPGSSGGAGDEWK